ncbi:MAG: glycosyltransferase 87 family protein [Dehalococcoidia bacterium]
MTSARRRFLLAFALLLVAGLLVRLPFLPRLGHAYDQESYLVWMGAIQDYSLAEVFDRTNTDYVGYHYILWALGIASGEDASQATARDKGLRIWLKVPGLLGDLLTASTIIFITRSLIAVRSKAGGLNIAGGRIDRIAARLRLLPADAIALAAGALFLLHPAVIYAGSYWGQQDSLVTFFMLLSYWLAWQQRPGWAGVALAIGTIVKPQPLVLGPLLAWIVWRRSSWPGLLRGGLAGAVMLVVGHFYFVLTGSGERIFEIYTFQITQTEHLSFGAYNLWWPFEHFAGARPDTAVLLVGAATLTFGTLATALVVVLLAASVYAARRGGVVQAMVAAGAWLAAYYLVAAGSHERYALPALAFLLAIVPLATWLRWPLLIYSTALFGNLIIALPLDRRWPQGDPVWLSLVVSGAMVVSVVWIVMVAIRGATDPSPR